MGATPGIPSGTFDFSNVVTVFNGQTLLGGVSVKVTRDSDATTDAVGANGDVVVVVNNDQRGTIEIEFMQSSPSLDFMSQQVQLFTLTRAFAPVSVTDLNGRSVASGAEAWAVKVADADYGKEEASRTFKIRVCHLNSFVGGFV